MSNLAHYIKLLREGDDFFNEKFKIRLFLEVAGVLHLIYCILFMCMKENVLALYNVAAVAFYIALVPSIKTMKTQTPLLLSSIEVIVHIVLCTIRVGNNWGFSYFIFSMVSIIFYCVLTSSWFKRKEIACVVYTLCYLIAFVGNTLVAEFVKPMAKYSDPWRRAFIFINIVFSFTFIAFALLLIEWDVIHNTKTMASKNTQLDEMANRDPLTKLYNRRYMNECLQRKLSELQQSGRLFGIIMGDIDNFKSVNDTYGHDIGDEVLVAVAETLNQTIRDNDVVCRWGGEEFLIVINGNKGITIEVAERMRKSISELELNIGDNKTLSITMTFGVTESITGYSIDKLVAIADDNLYKGKTSGKNKVVS